MYLRLAHKDDLAELKSMYKQIIDHMNHNHLQVWDEVYPVEFLEEDIENNCLYVLLENNDIIGAFALCESNVGKECIQWKDPQAQALYIDRLGVHIGYLRKGIASIMLNKAIEIARDKNIEYLRLFVVDTNKPAIHLYTKNGFHQMDGVYQEIVDNNLILYEYGFEIEVESFIDKLGLLK